MLINLYHASLSIQIKGEENLLWLYLKSENFIAAVWHTYVQAAILCLHSRNLAIYSDHLRSEEYDKSLAHFSRDIGIKTSRALGFEVIDASLGKQSKAILNYIKLIRNGTPALIAPDGPQGPIYKAKPGTVYIAQKSESVILPIGFSASRFITLPNWDDMILPLPFSKIYMIIGEPIQMKLNQSAEEQLNVSLILEKTLDKLCIEAGQFTKSK
jgi:hypothetical protein